MGRSSSRRAAWIALAAAVLLAICCSQACLAYTQGDPEFRAFYVDAWHAGFLSQSQVNTLLGVPGTSGGGDIRAANCNAVVVEVRREADVCYPSNMGEPYFKTGLSPSNFNALDAIIAAAHDTTGGKKRIEVHAWLVTFDSGTGTVHDAHDNPSDSANYWLTRDSGGTAATEFDPGHPNCLNYLVNVFMDVVNNHDVDGIHFDYIRFSNSGYGYNPTSLARYHAANPAATYPPGSSDPTFQQWRRDQVTAVVRQVYARVQAVKPQVLVSGSFYCGDPAPSSSSHPAFTACQAYKNYYSDWDQWVQDGIVDFGVPMTYFDLAGQYAADYGAWMNFEKDRKANRQMVIGPGLYMNYLNDSITELQRTRNASANGNYANGMCGYSYNAPYVDTKPGPPYGDWSVFSPRFVSDVCNSMVNIPARPWKASPTKAHISGRVTIVGTGAWADGASVTITGPSWPSGLTQYVDGTGFYAFIDLTPGTYNMTVSKTGYSDVTRSVSVTTGAVLGNMYINNFVIGCVPPMLSNLHATSASGTSDTIAWNSDVPATSQVKYGLTSTYSTTTPQDLTLVTSHSVVLTGLAPKTLYHYTGISARSEADGGCSTTAVDHTFTTCGPAVITNIQSTGITATTATITWTTDVASDSKVNYGTTGSYGSQATSASYVTSHTITLTGLTPYTPYHYQVVSDNGCTPASSTDFMFTTLDQPVMTSVTDETYTTSTTQLVATWSATDPISTIVRYEYAVGTTSGGTQVRGWTDAGLTTPYTITGLSLAIGTPYYISARAVNAAGSTSDPMASTGVRVANSAASVCAAKAFANGQFIGLPADLVVSAKFPTKFYLEDSNRVSGIRVEYTSSLVAGQTAKVFGTLGVTGEGERAILTPFVVPGSAGTAIQPLIVVGKAVGGCDLVISGVTTPGVTNAMGLNNVGLLVSMAGKVTKGVSDGFYLDDGVGPTDETGWSGIKIWTGASGVSYENMHVMVTGPISCRKPGAIVPQILARDIVTL